MLLAAVVADQETNQTQEPLQLIMRQILVDLVAVVDGEEDLLELELLDKEILAEVVMDLLVDLVLAVVVAVLGVLVEPTLYQVQLVVLVDQVLQTFMLMDHPIQ